MLVRAILLKSTIGSFASHVIRNLKHDLPVICGEKGLKVYRESMNMVLI